eukprot:GHVN01093312.1.p1 GENE.GHVN01093312.1~~GHVN01093312.1.p1  ORF type:complete len:728 (-),score=100.46 GHVN01093312.1:219-2402(-)
MLQLNRDMGNVPSKRRACEEEKTQENDLSRKFFIKEDGNVHLVVFKGCFVGIYNFKEKKELGKVSFEMSGECVLDGVWADSFGRNIFFGLLSNGKREFFSLGYGEGIVGQAIRIPVFAEARVVLCTCIELCGDQEKKAVLVCIQDSGIAQFRILEDLHNKDKIFQFDLCEARKEKISKVFLEHSPQGVHLFVFKEDSGKIDVFTSVYLEAEKTIEMSLVKEMPFGVAGIIFRDISSSLVKAEYHRSEARIPIVFSTNEAFYLVFLHFQSIIWLEKKTEACISVDSEHIGINVFIVSSLWVSGNIRILRLYLIHGEAVTDICERALDEDISGENVLQCGKITNIFGEGFFEIDTRLLFGRCGHTKKTTMIFESEEEFEKSRYSSEACYRIAERRRQRGKLLIDLLLHEIGMEQYPPQTNRKFWDVVKMAEKRRCEAIIQYMSLDLKIEGAWSGKEGFFVHLFDCGKEKDAMGVFFSSKIHLSSEAALSCLSFLIERGFVEESIEFMQFVGIEAGRLGKREQKMLFAFLIEKGQTGMAVCMAKETQMIRPFLGLISEDKHLQCFFNQKELSESMKEIAETSPKVAVRLFLQAGLFKEAFVLARRLELGGFLVGKECEVCSKLTKKEMEVLEGEVKRQGMLLIRKSEEGMHEKRREEVKVTAEEALRPVTATPGRVERKIKAAIRSEPQTPVPKERRRLSRSTPSTPKRVVVAVTPRRSARKRKPVNREM